MARKRKKPILLLPPDRESQKLPVFKAHDLRSLLSEAKASQIVGGDDIAVLAALRRRNEVQMQKLLRALGVDPSRPNAWLRGFFLLAHYHHGVGQLAWYLRRTNRNAAKWTPDDDIDLLYEVKILKEDGLSERRAVARIAADRNKWKLFPYREHRVTRSPRATRQEQREDALWARLQKLKASARGRSLLDLFGVAPKDGLSFWERTLRDLDEGDFLQQLEKNRNQRSVEKIS